jgi:signal transduction histidine kinase
VTLAIDGGPPRRPSRPRSGGPVLRFPRTLSNRLALGSLAVTGAAILSIYFYVVPQLSDRLRQDKLASLQSASARYSGAVGGLLGTSASARVIDNAVRSAAAGAGARATLYGTSSGTEGVSVFVLSDSTRASPLDVVKGSVVLRAARGGRTAVGVEQTGAGRIAEAARPLYIGSQLVGVLDYSAPLADVPRSVAVVRRQILIAGGIALLVAALGGFAAARALSRRVKRLETAAREVAEGDFSHPIPVDSDDEIGQLAGAFNDMQRQLAQLDSARKQFIATASHELRTPLFSLGGFVELLTDEDLDEATRDRFLVQIRAQIERLTKLATELLDLSRLEAGSLELRPETVDLGVLARTVTAEFIPALTQHDSELELRLRREPIEVVCDPDRVAQIMRILIDNAITHTPTGTPIQVTAARENSTLRVAVRDDGEGIGAGAAGRIFEPFFTSNDAQGSGLGLAIARELAERMRGALEVDSVPGRTTFTLELPVR